VSQRTRPLRVAVVGGGPAGIYAADFLTFDGDGTVQVDVVERLPVPFGLLRYGVAPDHLNIKAAGRTLAQVLERPEVQLYANVEIGRDVTIDELRTHYDALVYSVGASSDRSIGIPGEDLEGSLSATSFVNWYNGHPEAQPYDLSQVTSVAVVGVGNVALDVARLLLKDPTELLSTDVPQPVIEELRRSAVTDVHLLGRRGPLHAKFTAKELRELGELAGVGVVLDDGQLPVELPEDCSPGTKRNLAILRGWTERERTSTARRLHLHFGARPVEILGASSVSGIRLQRTSPEGEGLRETWDLPVQRVLRSVGYRSPGLPGVPFDPNTCTIPNRACRVVREDATPPGEYVVGWIRRGPVGILGTNRSDAEDAVASLREDMPALLATRPEQPPGIAGLLRDRGVRHVDVQGWQAVLKAEEAHGSEHGRGRVKLAEWDALLAAAGVARD
jgi:ferredoxin--NADP+ reductase